MSDTKNENGVEITGEFYTATVFETVGEFNAGADTISVRMEAYRDPNKLFVQPMSEIPAEMRKAAKVNGFKFWAQADISVDKQNRTESLKISDIEPMNDK